LLPSVVAASLLVFLFCFTSFGVILVLGGPQLATIEVEIYNQAVPFFNLPLAAALSLLQMIFTFTVMAVYTRLQAQAAVPLNLRPAESTQRRATTLGARLVVWGSLGGLLVLLLTPLLALALRSFSLGGTLTLRYYEALFTNPSQSFFYVPPAVAIRNSLLVAGATVALALLIGLISAYLLAGPSSPLKSLFDPLFMLPLGTSAVTLGLGYIVALDQPPLNLRASPLLLPVAHTLVAFPFVVRSLLPALRGLNPHWREAAGVLGASRARIVREIDLPIIARALLVGAVFAFTVSVGEFGATLLIARPDFPTMPVVIYRLLGAQGVLNQGQGLAMSTLLMLVCAVGFVLIERFRVGDIGEF
jgi:thiamine transport system permease protein